MTWLLACNGDPSTPGPDDFLAEVDFVVERGGIGPEVVSLGTGSIVAFDGEDEITWAARSDDGSTELLIVLDGPDVALVRYRKGQQHILDAHATCEAAQTGWELSFSCSDLHTEDGVVDPDGSEPWAITEGVFTGGSVLAGPRGELVAGEGYSWGVSVDGRAMNEAIVAPWRAGEWWVWHADDEGRADDVEFRVVPEVGQIEIERLAREQVALETPVELSLVGEASITATLDGLDHVGTEVDIVLWEDLVEGEDDKLVVIK